MCMDGAFVSTGFKNCKNATVSLRKYGSSECHHAATEIMISISKQVEDVCEQLMSQCRKEKAENRPISFKNNKHSLVSNTTKSGLKRIRK